MSEDPGARRAFLASQLAALDAHEFVLVALTEPPFPAVSVRLDPDRNIFVEVPLRADVPGLQEEQERALSELGLSRDDGAGVWRLALLGNATKAVDVADAVLRDVFGAGHGAPVDVSHGSMRDQHEAEQRLAAMRQRVEPVLAALTGRAPVIDDDGDYIVDVGPSRVFVAPRALPGRPPVIRVFAITNAGVNVGSELGMFLSRLNFTLMFGRFSIDVENGAVWLDETLLGEHVTDEELRFTVEQVAVTATEWDQKIAAAFGGRVRDPAAAEAPDAAPRSKPGEGGYL